MMASMPWIFFTVLGDIKMLRVLTLFCYTTMQDAGNILITTQGTVEIYLHLKSQPEQVPVIMEKLVINKTAMNRTCSLDEDPEVQRDIRHKSGYQFRERNR